MDDRRKILEAYSKQLSEGNPLAEGFITPSKKLDVNALRARNLAEDALANEVLKNTGVPIPDSGASLTKREDFLNRIVKERYPEFEPDLQINRFIKDHGAYAPKEGKILVRETPDLLKQVSTGLHEAAHKYDDKVLNFDGTDNVKLKSTQVPKGKFLPDMDPAEVYELMAKGHHAEIPNLREGSFGLGALKSMLKSGTFKGVAPIGVGAAITAAALPEEASAADFIPGLDMADNAGSAMDDKMMKTEISARKNYDNSPAHQARLQALQGFTGKKR
jgi:hypothetical protein